MDLTVTVAVYNEEESLPHLCSKLHEVLSQMGRTYEVILVDDGSKDRSWEVMCEQAEKLPHFKLIRFRRNFGQTAAISAGFRESQGEVVVTLDADLQNDPADIPLLLERMEQGNFDVVSGWRKDRQDRFINRRLPSVIANWLIGRMTDVRLHDYGCSLKAYRCEIVKSVRLYGEMHRFIPALAHWVGGTIDEMPVRHHARRYGQSKYGISRTLRVVLDLLTVKFLLTYSTRPIQVFGRFGMAFFGFAAAILAVLGLDRLTGPWWSEVYLLKRPFWVITPLMFLGFALQFMVMGLLGELMTRTYHESQDKPIYSVREVLTSSEIQANKR